MGIAFEVKLSGLEDVGKALQLLEDRVSWGKVVVDVVEESGRGLLKL